MVTVNTLNEQILQLSKPTQIAEYFSSYKQSIKMIVVDNKEDLWLGNHEGLGFQLIEGANMSIYIKDKEGRYTFLNARARDLMNFHGKKVIGEKDTDVLKDENKKLYREWDEEIMSILRPKSYYEPWTPENSEMMRYHKTVRYPVVLRSRKKGPAIGVVSIAEDITYKAEIKVAGQVLKLISHEWAMDLLRIINWNNIEIQEVRKLAPLLNFLSSYLGNLNWYFELEEEKNDRFLKECSECNIVEDVLKPMKEVSSAYDLVLDNMPELQINLQNYDDLKSATFIAHIPLLKLLIFQQIRNHKEHGNIDEPLLINVVFIDKICKLEFVSSGDKPSSKNLFDDVQKRVWEPKRIWESEPEKSGLNLSYRIAELHQGNALHKYENGANIFVYTISRDQN